MSRFRKLQDESGQALTEFAVVMPVLFILIFAIVQGGLTLNDYLRLTDAVRVGARAASINGSQGYTAANSAARTAITDAVGGMPVERIAVGAPAGAWTAGSPVEVEASVPFAVTLPLVGTIASGTLTSRSTQRIE